MLQFGAAMHNHANVELLLILFVWSNHNNNLQLRWNSMEKKPKMMLSSQEFRARFHRWINRSTTRKYGVWKSDQKKLFENIIKKLAEIVDEWCDLMSVAAVMKNPIDFRFISSSCKIEIVTSNWFFNCYSTTMMIVIMTTFPCGIHHIKYVSLN